MELQVAVKKWAVIQSSLMKLDTTTRQLLSAGSEDRVDLVSIQVNQELMQGKLSGFSALDECVFNLSLAAGKDEDDLEVQLNDSDLYKTKYSTLCMEIIALMSVEEAVSDCIIKIHVDSGLHMQTFKFHHTKHFHQLSFLYDQLETKLRALETLGVTSDKYAVMLFHLVESCLAEDLLRARKCSAVGHKGEKERISIAMKGFNISNTSNSKLTMVGGPAAMEASSATATHLVNTKGRISAAACIFCQGAHISGDCFKALSGHIAKNCKMTCMVCGARYIQLMCPKLEQVKTEPPGKFSIDKKGMKLANHSSPDILLQTLIVTTKEKTAEMGYQTTGEEQLRRGLFDDPDRKECQKILKEIGIEIEDDGSPIEVLVGADRSFYVNNSVTSVKQDELKFMEESTDIFLEAKFELLRKGSPKPCRANTISVNAQIAEIGPEPLVKRKILSAAHKLFDTIGLPLTVVFIPKLLLQQLWKCNLNWDAPVQGQLKRVLGNGNTKSSRPSKSGCSADVLIQSKWWERHEWPMQSPSEWPVFVCRVNEDE
ncbi:hypothetical protein PR048_011016 [Dryococelus australis]|uniref:Uncharacterized protein n=1 Tax=Dryococelus australis TaxID=614101 RepID=A0ABQ9HKD8_9NEOP|nr:hypothetical protein PR048_011016 [Dryococelus australis]